MQSANLSNFDLSIETYDISYCEDLFSLVPNGYTVADIDRQETKFRNSITNNKYTPYERTQLTDFGRNLRNKLAANLEMATFKHQFAPLIEQQPRMYSANAYAKQPQPPTINAGDTYIIPHAPATAIIAQSSDTISGKLDPIARRTLHKNLDINTKFRDNYHTSLSSDFHVNLPLRISNVVSMTLTALEFPQTFYNISRSFGNTSFVIVRSDVRYVITVPDGNYTYAVLIGVINSRIRAYADFADTMTCSIDQQNQNGTGLVRFTDSSDVSFGLEFTESLQSSGVVGPLQSRLGWMLGFRRASYEDKAEYVSESLMNVLACNYAYLVIKDFTNNVSETFIGAFSQSILNSDILARIPLSEGALSYKVNDSIGLVSTKRVYFGGVNIQTLQVQLLDEYGRVLNINGADFSFVLTLETVHDI